MDLTTETLAAAVEATPERAQVWVDPLNVAARRFNVATPMRLAGWLATIAVESGRLRYVEEDLRYSADALCRVWPSRFRKRRQGEPVSAALGADGMAIAEWHARKPESIANVAYGGRMGNGSSATGDGWRFRGRGLIQLTGRENYRRASLGLVVDLEANPDALLEPEMAAASAGWFWGARGINLFADRGDIIGMRRTVNGGTHGLDDFRELYATARRALGIPLPV